ncbi:sacsin N-terminal ATP-binding-like domain-containing protein [Chitinophaga sp. RAB17]|uniref:sacsin N-terminal ATP-binding-like domain-containing protein n=1 Tax=Chitinophaga sp. RAB17 TaxID=3233049 RepID=UPI003F91D3A7
MNYAEILSNSRDKATDRLLATKILDLMDKLRMGSGDNAARRWIWELLQNAKDVAYDDMPVSVQINLVEGQPSGQVTFSHNGRPFDVDNITSLIHQVSSKARKQDPANKRRTTGKFGTGFLSTHLLSEVVTVHGYIKEAELPFKQFSIQLDRSPAEIDDIVETTTTSLDELRAVLLSTDYTQDLDPMAFNTSFVYELDEEKLDVAATGLSDLHVSLPYTLAFSDAIAEVLIEHSGIAYKVLGRKSIRDTRIEIITINEVSELMGSDESRHIVVVRGDKAAIAIEVEELKKGKYAFEELPEEIPMLFCDFPLIGSEQFPFPVIINASEFNINEPRNGVYLSGKALDQVRENEGIMYEAVALFEELLKYASEHKWERLYMLAKVRSAVQSEWLSKEWFDKQVLKDLRELLLTVPIVDTAAGRRAIKEGDTYVLQFPDGGTEEIREGVWVLCETYASDEIPLKKDVHHWAQVIWTTSTMVNLRRLAGLIKEQKNIEGLEDFLNVEEGSGEIWLRRFYQIMNLDAIFLEEVISDKHIVIPNQHGVFKKRSELNVEREMEEVLKDILSTVGIDIREKLVPLGAGTGEVKYSVYKGSEAISQINAQLTKTEVVRANKVAASQLIVSLYSEGEQPQKYRSELYHFSKAVFGDQIVERTITNVKDADLWKYADQIVLEEIVKMVAASASLEQLTADLGLDNTLSFLHDLVRFLVNNDKDALLNLKKHPILPNQHGNFVIKDNLDLDDGSIPEDFKLIAEKFGVDYKSTLLDKDIWLELPENRTVTGQEVATEIVTLVQQSLPTIPRPAAVKEAFKLLLRYFKKNDQEAAALFGDLYYHQHKLYDDEEISDNMKKVEELDAVMKDYDIESMEDLKQLLEENGNRKKNKKREPITVELLAASGITSKEEYDNLIGTSADSEIFRHYTTPTLDMYLRADAMIKRARENVIKHLSELSNYDTTELEDHARTVLAGIKKHGVYITVVVRPSDNEEVLIFYPAEISALDTSNAELWVEDGKTVPFHLTLGKILRSTNINRIPIDGINR